MRYITKIKTWFGYYIVVPLLLFSVLVQAANNIVPAFRDGVKPEAKWQDLQFFNMAGQCTQQVCNDDQLATQPNGQEACSAKAKDCLAKYMQQHGASEQAIAFMSLAEVPAIISEIRAYKSASVVHADMQWADAKDGFFIISKAGYVIPIHQQLDISNDPQYKKLLISFPKASLDNGPGSIDWPQVSTLKRGSERYLFEFPMVDGCRACKVVGYAKISFTVAKDGKYLGWQLLQIAPAS